VSVAGESTGAGDLSADAVAAVDAGAMAESIVGLGEQLAGGWASAREALEPFVGQLAATGFDGVAVCGMGGSAIGGDVVAACVPGLTAPFTVVRGYELPPWVSSQTLIVAVSYSGDTEETVACAEWAAARGRRPVCVTTGGRLAELAAREGLPLVPVAAGLQPRAALGCLTAAVAAALDAACLVGGLDEQVAEAAHLLCNMATVFDPEVDPPVNQAKAVALALHGRVPLVYGAGLTAPAARRWKCELNENAEMPAFFAELPEADHNEVAGWTAAGELASSVVVVALDDAAGDPRLARRMDATLEMVAPRVGAVLRVATRGASPLARVFSSIYVGDAASLYLAVLNGVDPTPVTAITRLKAQLAAPDA